MLYAFIMTVTGQAWLVGPLPSFESCRSTMYALAAAHRDEPIVANCIEPGDAAVRVVMCDVLHAIREVANKPRTIELQCAKGL